MRRYLEIISPKMQKEIHNKVLTLCCSSAGVTPEELKKSGKDYASMYIDENGKTLVSVCIETGRVVVETTDQYDFTDPQEAKTITAEQYNKIIKE